MKKMIRSLFVAFALTGMVVSANTTTASAQKPIPKPGSLPIPMCPPDDPNACGMGQPK